MSEPITTYSASTQSVLARKQKTKKELHLQIRANEHWFGAAKTKLSGATEQRGRKICEEGTPQLYVATIAAYNSFKQ